MNTLIVAKKWLQKQFTSQVSNKESLSCVCVCVFARKRYFDPIRDLVLQIHRETIHILHVYELCRTKQINKQLLSLNNNNPQYLIDCLSKTTLLIAGKWERRSKDGLNQFINSIAFQNGLIVLIPSLVDMLSIWFGSKLVFIVCFISNTCSRTKAMRLAKPFNDP